MTTTSEILRSLRSQRATVFAATPSFLDSSSCVRFNFTRTARSSSPVISIPVLRDVDNDFVNQVGVEVGALGKTPRLIPQIALSLQQVFCGFVGWKQDLNAKRFASIGHDNVCITEVVRVANSVGRFVKVALNNFLHLLGAQLFPKQLAKCLGGCGCIDAIDTCIRGCHGWGSFGFHDTDYTTGIEAVNAKMQKSGASNA